MKLNDARRLAYDAKARQLEAHRIENGDVDLAILTLEAGRAVEHRRDEDVRLARQLRSHVENRT